MTSLITNPSQISVALSAEADQLYLIIDNDQTVIPFLLAHLATAGPVCVLTADSRLPIQELMREIRKKTLELEETLDRVSLSRITRCYQIPDLTPTIPTDQPLIILQPLSIFRQEGVEMAAARRLLAQLLLAIEQRDGQTVLVTGPAAWPTVQPEDTVLLDMLLAAADHRIEFGEFQTEGVATQLGLFTAHG